jgi:hypothetical protein
MKRPRTPKIHMSVPPRVIKPHEEELVAHEGPAPDFTDSSAAAAAAAVLASSMSHPDAVCVCVCVCVCVLCTGVPGLPLESLSSVIPRSH